MEKKRQSIFGIKVFAVELACCLPRFFFCFDFNSNHDGENSQQLSATCTFHPVEGCY